MPIKIDGEFLVLEDKNGIQGRVKFTENSFEVFDVNEEHYLDFVMMIEEFLFMKYNSIFFVNPQIELEDWTTENGRTFKHKAPNPYTMQTFVPLRGVSPSTDDV